MKDNGWWRYKWVCRRADDETRNSSARAGILDAIAPRVVAVAVFVAQHRLAWRDLAPWAVIWALDGHAAPRAVDSIAFGIDPIVVLVHPIRWNRVAWIARLLIGHAIVELWRADAHTVAGANRIGRLGSDGRVLATGALAAG